MQAPQHRAGNLLPVLEAVAHLAGREHQVEGVEVGGRSIVSVKLPQQVALHAVPEHDLPHSVEDEGRVGFVRVQDKLECPPRLGQLLIIEGSLPVTWGETGVQ